MVTTIRANHPLRRLFQSLVDNIFIAGLGAAQPKVTDYIANMLVEFVHVDNIYKVTNVKGKRLEEVAEMLVEGDMRLNASSFDREREIHKHIGDFTLFWTGVYPENLRFLRASARSDHLIDYMGQGKKSYYIASTFDTREYRHEAPILRALSEQFESCVYGLRLVREEWEKLERASVRRAKDIFPNRGKML